MFCFVWICAETGFVEFGKVVVWWQVCRMTSRQIEICFYPWYNPLWLTGLKVKKQTENYAMLPGACWRRFAALSPPSPLVFCFGLKRPSSVHRLQRQLNIKGRTHQQFKGHGALACPDYFWVADFRSKLMLSSVLAGRGEGRAKGTGRREKNDLCFTVELAWRRYNRSREGSPIPPKDWPIKYR